MLKLSNITKSFPGVRALSEINLEIRAGEIHALVGKNGAGKSTMIKIIAGAYQPDAGEIEFDGHRLHAVTPASAKRAGIHVIYQEFVLFPHLSVAENIFLGHERRGRFGLVDHKQTRRDAVDLLTRVGVDIDPCRIVSDLTVADQQMIEISKALVHKVKLLILDEPAAVISGREADLFFARLKALRDEGVAILYVSHRLEEIFQIADRVTVFKDGEHVITTDIKSVTRYKLISHMVGRDLKDNFPAKRPPSGFGKIVLKADNISVNGRVKQASIALRAGEITGLAGMVGSGRTEMAMGLFGGLPVSSGTVTVDGEDFAAMTPALAIARQEIGKYRIACRGPATAVATMSGGNQQKVIVARWARTCRKVLILDEPTRGVDVGAKTEIYKIMNELASQGIAILMISSELPEVVGMSDRVIVMREGVISGELRGNDINEQAIMSLATQHMAA